MDLGTHAGSLAGDWYSMAFILSQLKSKAFFADDGAAISADYHTRFAVVGLAKNNTIQGFMCKGRVSVERIIMCAPVLL